MPLLVQSNDGASIKRERVGANAVFIAFITNLGNESTFFTVY